MNQEKIGAFIAMLRREKGYTQRELAVRLELSEKTISKWECGKGLPEVTYMEPLRRLLGISVNELLAGERIPILDLLKKMDEARIALVRQLALEQLKYRILKLYGLDIDRAELSDYGAGSLTYFITCKGQKFVVKYASENEMNHPEAEPEVCAHLLKKGIPVCRFVENSQGNVISVDENGRRFHVQHFIEGAVYDYNHAPKWLMGESVQMLAKIHSALKDFPDLPVGIGADFFRCRTPQAALKGYQVTLQKAIASGDVQIAEEIRSNMRVLEHFPPYKFHMDQFTCTNTHGDFMITQLICGENRINGVIDWTTACVHPVVWEMIRSYVYASPLCVNGEINIADFTEYVRTYLEDGALNSYDLENMAQMFFYFTAVCDFYGQYYDSLTKNRAIYLQQARLSSKLLRWFEAHVEELRSALQEIAHERL